MVKLSIKCIKYINVYKPFVKCGGLGNLDKFLLLDLGKLLQLLFSSDDDELFSSNAEP